MKNILLALLALVLFPAFSVAATAQMTAHTLNYAPGKSITLSLPSELDIHVAASGLKRVRFFAQAPDGRIFATGMYNLADNTRGTVYILGGWDAKAQQFTQITHYLDGLRNPNNLAFWTDPATKQTWLYLPLTDKLVRYKYNAGDMKPSVPEEVLTRYPDYGLNYKYGGWHLTRTVAVGELHGRTRLYVSTGSSCNYCREREAVRASVTAMDMDGKNEQIVAHGMRNAVDLRFVKGLDGGALFATNMGDDHLGDRLPEDTFFELDSNAKPGAIFSAHQAAPVPAGMPLSEQTKINDLTSPAPNYGWPTCYFAHGKPVHDVTPLPDMDLSAVVGRPANAGTKVVGGDSVYGKQEKDIAAAGVNLAAKEHVQTGPNLGPVPEPLGSCESVPAAYTTFAAHSSPLGMAYFAGDNVVLKDSFLVALHGAGHPRIGTGYRVVRFTQGDRVPRDFVTGFLTTSGAGVPVVHGRPCGLLRLGPDTFLLTDDYLGLVYSIGPKH